MASDSVHRIFGIELSPYSVKVRSYFRYKGIPHEWVVRSAARMDAIPAVGEHTERILAELGFGSEDIAALLKDAAISVERRKPRAG